MGVVMRLANFIGGSLVGAVIGAGVTAFVAPERGKEFQQTIRTRVQDGRLAKFQAEAETEERMKDEFRRFVGDETALRATKPRSENDSSASATADSSEKKDTGPLS